MPDNLRLLGKIVRLQIQKTTLIFGERPNRQYNPEPLMAVDELTLTPQGALARLPEGGSLLDVHHAQHPRSHYEGDNALSVGFTSHYAAIRGQFGAAHLFDGCAGENIIVETGERVEAEMLAQGLAIQPQAGGPLIWLGDMRVAHPCRPFSGYVMGGSEATVKEALQYLDGGLRGFYCGLAGERPATVAVGDRVLLPAG